MGTSLEDSDADDEFYCSSCALHLEKCECDRLIYIPACKKCSECRIAILYCDCGNERTHRDECGVCKAVLCDGCGHYCDWCEQVICTECKQTDGGFVFECKTCQKSIPFHHKGCTFWGSIEHYYAAMPNAKSCIQHYIRMDCINFVCPKCDHPQQTADDWAYYGTDDEYLCSEHSHLRRKRRPKVVDPFENSCSDDDWL